VHRIILTPYHKYTFSSTSCAENPFQYWYYEAIFSLGAAINRTLAQGGDPYNGTHLLEFFKNGQLELQHQTGWFPDQTERISKYFNEIMELDVTFSVSQFFSPSLFGSGSKESAREIPKCFKNRPQDNEWILNSEGGRKCVDEKGKDIETRKGLFIILRLRDDLWRRRGALLGDLLRMELGSWFPAFELPRQAYLSRVDIHFRICGYQGNLRNLNEILRNIILKLKHKIRINNKDINNISLLFSLFQPLFVRATFRMNPRHVDTTEQNATRRIPSRSSLLQLWPGITFSTNLKQSLKLRTCLSRCLDSINSFWNCQARLKNTRKIQVFR